MVKVALITRVTGPDGRLGLVPRERRTQRGGVTLANKNAQCGGIVGAQRLVPSADPTERPRPDRRKSKKSCFATHAVQ